jgi:hypothetical protein
MPVNPYPYEHPSLMSSAAHVEAVTPSDSTDLTRISKAIWVGTGGNIQVTTLDMADGTSTIIPGVQNGTLLHIHAKRIWAASTTASGIVNFS